MTCLSILYVSSERTATFLKNKYLYSRTQIEKNQHFFKIFLFFYWFIFYSNLHLYYFISIFYPFHSLVFHIFVSSDTLWKVLNRTLYTIGYIVLILFLWILLLFKSFFLQSFHQTGKKKSWEQYKINCSVISLLNALCYHKF